MEALGVLLIVGVIIAASIASSRQREKIDKLLRWLGENLHGGHDTKVKLAWGEVGGAKVWYRLTTRGSGKNTTHWTEVDVEVPAQYPLRFFLRKHGWLDQGKIERGEMVDVIVGEPLFDQQFLVEAAPADIARLLLDQRERTYLMGLAQKLWFEITTHTVGTKTHLKLSIRSWVFDIADAMCAIEAMAAIGGRLREAYAASERAAEVKDVGSPYRPMLDDTSAREAADKRLAEVARVDRIRTHRAAREQMVAVMGVVLFVIIAMVALLTK